MKRKDATTRSGVEEHRKITLNGERCDHRSSRSSSKKEEKGYVKTVPGSGKKAKRSDAGAVLRG